MSNTGDILYITSNYEIRPSESDVMSFLHQDEVHVLAVELVIASFAICLNSQRLDKPRYAHNTTMPLIVININSQYQTTSVSILPALLHRLPDSFRVFSPIVLVEIARFDIGRR